MDWLENLIVTYARYNPKITESVLQSALKALSSAEHAAVSDAVDLFRQRGMTDQPRAPPGHPQSLEAKITQKMIKYLEVKFPHYTSSQTKRISILELHRLAKMAAKRKRGTNLYEAKGECASPWLYLNWDLQRFLNQTRLEQPLRGLAFSRAISILQRLYGSPFSKVTPRFTSNRRIKCVLDLYYFNQADLRNAEPSVYRGQKTLWALDYILVCKGLPRIGDVINSV